VGKTKPGASQADAEYQVSSLNLLKLRHEARAPKDIFGVPTYFCFPPCSRLREYNRLEIGLSNQTNSFLTLFPHARQLTAAI
jgi:hypothetical protein